MADSPRRMMQKVIEFKNPYPNLKSAAEYVLQHDDWLELMRGRQAYFRDFILMMVQQRIKFNIDDTEIPKIIKTMMDSGYLWDVFNEAKRNDRIARMVMTSFFSLQASAFPSNEENFFAVFKVLLASRSWIVPFAVNEDDDANQVHPLIVERLVSDPEATERLIKMVQAKVTDPMLALSLIDDDVVAPLVAGAL